MTIPFFLRPSTRLREIDLTQRIDAPASSIGCVVGEFRRGPLQPTYVNGVLDDFYRLYGSVSDPKLSFAHDTCSAFLSQGSNLLVQRVVNTALHSGVHVFYDDVPTDGGILFVPYAVGRQDGHDAGVSAPALLVLDDDLIAANTFDMNVTDGVTVTAISQVTYATSHANTMALIVSSIQTALNTFASGGYALLLPADGNGNQRTIAIYAPPGHTLEYTSPTVASGSSQAGAVVKTAANFHMFSVQSENPGVWGNDIGVKITGRDLGERQRKRLVFNAKLITGNSFTVNINGTAISAPISFTTDSDTTMAAIATAIQNHAAVSSATVETVAAGRENDRSIVVVAETAGPDQLTITEPVVSGGASQAAVTILDVLNGVEADGSFVFEVFSRSNTVLPAERFTVSMANVTDARGTQLRIDAQVNESSSASINVRVIPNPKFLSDTTFINNMKGYISNPDLSVPTTIRWLTGGDDGLTVLSSQLRTAIQSLDDRVRYPFNILMNAGYTAVEVQQELVTLSIKRNDCFAILDMPSDKQTSQASRNYRLYDMNIDSNHGAVYTPDLLISDLATSERRYIPPSGFVGAVFAYNDRVASVAHAPAGLNRGVLRNVLGLRVNYKPGDEELLHPIGVNCIIDKPGNGPTIMGEETLQVKKSLLSSVHARRLVSALEVALIDGLDYTLFEPNTEFTRNQAVQLGRNFLQPYRNSGALYEFKIQCDDKNNPPELIDADALSYRVFLKVVRAIKGILLDVVLVRTGASISELETQSF